MDNELQSELSLKRHSLAHILALAVLRTYPQAKFAIGPDISDGFYYDLDLGEEKISPVDLIDLEKKMKHIVKQNLKFVRSEKDIDEALAEARAGDDCYKLEILEGLKAEGHNRVSFYSLGEFSDLCRGPHIESSGQIEIGSFKLNKIAGAYWRGDEKNKMLSRIYGLAFLRASELEQHLKMLSEAEKRDHRKLGKELGLFIFSDLVGSGLPLYAPKGAIVRRKIIDYSNNLQKKIGYEEVHTPNMNRAELFKVSGHYEKYRDDMFRVVSNYSQEEYFLKPMNCPQHTQIYAAKKRSYRDLPIRLADFSNLYRDEKPGELNGLTRLRAFAQDDGHCFCREDQIKEEFLAVLKVIEEAMSTYGMDYSIRLSLWDENKKEKYLGEATIWEKSQKLLEEILLENKIDYVKSPGEAAIYGPKMDLISKDSLGREWQISTIQLDFIMPERFGLKYTDSDGAEKTPVMIHRAIVGSPERFLGILIEHYGGAFPTWLAPVQVKIISVGEKHADYCRELKRELSQLDLRLEIDIDNETVANKIRQAVGEKIPYLVVVGDQELSGENLAVRRRGEQKIEIIKKDEFIQLVLKEAQVKC